MSTENPFLSAAGDGAKRDALRRQEWERQQEEWKAHVAACEAIMISGVLARLELAAVAGREWDYQVEVSGVTRTETCTGIVHLRAKMVLEAGTQRMAQLEFIGSPKSMVIAAEGGRAGEKRRWRKVSFGAEEILKDVDAIIEDFLRWGIE